MVDVPQRLGLAKMYRSVYQSWERYMPVPKVNPSVYQVLALVLSFGVLIVEGKWMKFLLVLAIILCDWWDGATARKLKIDTEAGYMTDVAIDRLSEMVMFYPITGGVLAELLFGVAILNVALSFISYRIGRHYVLPLRFAYLLVIWI